jgi:hypothetical protein
MSNSLFFNPEWIIHRRRGTMKFLCLAYGDEKDWKVLSKAQQDALLETDEMLKKRGDLIVALRNEPTTITAWDGTPSVTQGPYASSKAPLAGFSIIEAADLKEAYRLVKDSPCARAGGAIEIRPIFAMNKDATVV